MAEPSLAMLQVLMERMLEQQRRVADVLERIERRLEDVDRWLVATETAADIRRALEAG